MWAKSTWLSDDCYSRQQSPLLPFLSLYLRLNRKWQKLSNRHLDTNAIALDTNFVNTLLRSATVVVRTCTETPRFKSIETLREKISAIIRNSALEKTQEKTAHTTWE